VVPRGGGGKVVQGDLRISLHDCGIVKVFSQLQLGSATGAWNALMCVVEVAVVYCSFLVLCGDCGVYRYPDPSHMSGRLACEPWNVIRVRSTPCPTQSPRQYLLLSMLSRISYSEVMSNWESLSCAF
jgi:hypothetical protein